ncbi:MAG TPA: hypothetical protein VFO03_09175 [Gaiellaceae bacterium]|nr:hypothetical protein [Gaiellaceae bacterium]
MKAALFALTLAAVALAPAARADGLPVMNVDVGPDGVTAPGLADRIVAFPSPTRTLVARIEKGTGKVRAWRRLRETLTVPAVAYDSSADGLARNGSTMTLITPRNRFPRATTTFALLDGTSLAERRRIMLRGDFSFDAISPDGRWIYVIHYTSIDDPLQYEVRALDTRTGRLTPTPVVDPRKPGEAMNGNPLTRAWSPDGRWAFTLYDGTEHPFVHALDTVGRSARCIDLDWLHGRRDLWGLRFIVGSDGRELRIRSRSDTVAVVDTRRWEAAPSAPGGRRFDPWIVVLLAGGLLLAAGVAYRSTVRRRASSTSFGGATSA